MKTAGFHWWQQLIELLATKVARNITIAPLLTVVDVFGTFDVSDDVTESANEFAVIATPKGKII